MTVYYVTPAATGSGDGLSISSPMTLAQAEAVATAGDEVRLCGSPFNLTGTATWAFDNTSLVGSENSPIVISGYAADGTTQAQVTIDGAGMNALTDIMTVTGRNWMVLNRITFANAKRYGFSSTTDYGHFIFLDCIFSSCATAGCYTNVSASGFRFYRCRLTGNGTGFLASSNSRGHILAVDCVFDHNTVNGSYDAVYSGSATTYYLRPVYLRCKFYRNGGDGLKFYSSATAGGIFVHNCTFFANGGAGINALGSHGQIMIEDSILLDNTTYGIQLNSSIIGQVLSCKNLCSYGNTSGHIDINSGTLPGTGHVLADPAFVSETDGSEDLTPTNLDLRKSLALAGGTTYFWPGAVQPAFTIYSSTGGGGGATASEIADAVLQESVGDHSGVSGSLAAVLAAVPTAAQNAAAVAASSTPIPANVTQVNGSAASVATDLATASALETVDTVVDGIAANMATATAVANVSSDLSTMSNFVSGTLWETLDLVYSGQNVIAGNTNGLGEMISDGAFTEAALANAPTAATVDLSPVTEVTDQLGGMISGGAFTAAALANIPTPEETAGTVLYTIDPVVDAVGNPIFGARVTVTTDLSGADFVTQQFTNEFGVCSFRLAPGVYYLRISADGKSDLVAQQITVEAE